MSSDYALQLAAGAINKASSNMNIIANNIANINTSGYIPMDVYSQDWLNDIEMEAYLSKMYLADEKLFTTNGVYNTFSDKAVFEFGTDGDLSRALSNKVDLAREFTNLIANEHALEANAKVITTVDTMYGVVLDMKV